MISRKDFLKQALVGATALSLGRVATAQSATAQSAASRKSVMGANGKIRIGVIGVNSRGRAIAQCLAKLPECEVTCVCDVDSRAIVTCQEAVKKITGKTPRGERDIRKMLESDDFEAVAIAMPDHWHAPAAIMAMQAGKHVYVEKPMGRTFQECQLMIDAARRNPQLVTQGGNQGHSEANYFQFKAWTEAGIIKDVTHVDAHMNNSRRWHGYDVNISRYPQEEAIPEGMDWDLWHTTQLYHEFNPKYHPGNWRSWYDFGMGALGDWGAHLIDTIHEFLNLGLPYEVAPLKLEGWNNYFFPMSSTLQFKFPRRGEMPAMTINWWDGIGNYPSIPDGYGESKMGSDVPTIGGKPAAASAVKLNPGTIMYSKDLIFKRGSHGATTQIIPESKAKEMASKLPEVPKSPSNHYENFLLACMNEERSRSPFEVFGPLCQVFCLGVIAQRLNQKIVFDRETKHIIDNPFADALLVGAPPRKGWEEFYKM